MKSRYWFLNHFQRPILILLECLKTVLQTCCGPVALRNTCSRTRKDEICCCGGWRMRRTRTWSRRRWQRTKGEAWLDWAGVRHHHSQILDLNFNNTKSAGRVGYPPYTLVIWYPPRILILWYQLVSTDTPIIGYKDIILIPWCSDIRLSLSFRTSGKLLIILEELWICLNLMKKKPHLKLVALGNTRILTD